MALDKITNDESFFVEGVGKAIIQSDDGTVNLMHLQNANIDLSSKMEDIFGGEGNFSLYSYQTEKSAKFTFTNASMSLGAVKVSQGTVNDTDMTLFDTETVTVGANGEVGLSQKNIDGESIIASQNGIVIPVTATAGNYTVDKSLAGNKLEVFYNYTVKENAVGTSVLTTSVPGFAKIFYRTKALRQKNGRVVRVYITVYKARSDGSLKLDFKHKNAYAPELTFNAVDPEREDKKFVTFTVKDVTNE